MITSAENAPLDGDEASSRTTDHVSSSKPKKLSARPTRSPQFQTWVTGIGAVVMTSGIGAGTVTVNAKLDRLEASFAEVRSELAVLKSASLEARVRELEHESAANGSRVEAALHEIEQLRKGDRR